MSTKKKIYANPSSYESYLLKQREILKRFRNKEVLICAIQIVNFIGYRESFHGSDSSPSKSNTYVNSVLSFLTDTDDMLIGKTIRILVKIGHVIKNHGDNLTLSDDILQYFQLVTGNNNYKKSKKTKSSKREKNGKISNNLNGSERTDTDDSSDASPPSFLFSFSDIDKVLSDKFDTNFSSATSYRVGKAMMYLILSCKNHYDFEFDDYDSCKPYIVAYFCRFGFNRIALGKLYDIALQNITQND